MINNSENINDKGVEKDKATIEEVTDDKMDEVLSSSTAVKSPGSEFVPGPSHSAGISLL